MAFLAWVADNILILLRPSILLWISMYYFAMTIFEILIYERQPSKLLKFTELRHRGFARVWAAKGEAMSIEMPGPLDSLLAKCSGTILDVGPGSGEMLTRLHPTRITAIYGAEPAADLHPKLISNASKAGFRGKYHTLLCGAEPESLIPALHQRRILGESELGGTVENGVFDEIICVRVLCGVPRPRETIRGLYSLLKPSGRMVICEHVVNPWRTEGRLVARLFQTAYTWLGWPLFVGCELQRNTEALLREAGEWKEFNIQSVQPQHVIPFIVGDLIKTSVPVGSYR